MEKWIYYDPDFRKDPPKNGPFCERCQKPIKDTSKAIRVETTYDLPKERENEIGWAHCKESETGKHFIGADCWKIINK